MRCPYRVPAGTSPSSRIASATAATTAKASEACCLVIVEVFMSQSYGILRSCAMLSMVNSVLVIALWVASWAWYEPVINFGILTAAGILVAVVDDPTLAGALVALLVEVLVVILVVGQQQVVALAVVVVKHVAPRRLAGAARPHALRLLRGRPRTGLWGRPAGSAPAAMARREPAAAGLPLGACGRF